MFNMSNDNVIKYYGSEILHDWDMSFEKFGGLPNVVAFYKPGFRRDVLWYGAVRPSVRPSVRLLARKNIEGPVRFFSNSLCRCA